MSVYRHTSIVRLSTAALTVALSTSALAQTRATDVEKFLTKWVPTTNPNSYGSPNDNLFKVDGGYCVPYGGAQPVCLEFANATFSPSTAHHGTLSLTVPANVYQGAEIATAAGWEPQGAGTTPPFGPSHLGYGYYEASMRPSCVQGEISSFFWIQAPGYGPLEWDVEFPNPPGHTFTDVHWTIHPSGKSVDFQLGFNPCNAFHRYGFLWTAGKIVYTVDGKSKYTFTDSSLVSTATGFLMANAWDGNPNWGGGPPTQNAVNSYDWMVYYAGATAVPDRLAWNRPTTVASGQK